MAKITVIPNNPAMLGMVDLKPDVFCVERDGDRLSMQILKPMWQSGGKGFPLVVFIQGSAWTKPNQFWQLPQLSLLARKGFVIASVTHRSAFTAKAPAFLNDVRTAIRFLRAHAEEYDIDKSRVCAWGTSSGGNTALLLGLTGDEPAADSDWAEESAKVQCVVDCFGPTDLNRMMNVQYKDVATDDAKSLFMGLAGGTTAEECEEPLKKISPIQYVRPGLKLPPFLLLHGDADDVVLYEDTEVFYNRLVECGYEAELVRITDAPHEGSFWSMPLLDMIFDFIQNNL